MLLLLLLFRVHLLFIYCFSFRFYCYCCCCCYLCWYWASFACVAIFWFFITTAFLPTVSGASPHHLVCLLSFSLMLFVMLGFRWYLLSYFNDSCFSSCCLWFWCYFLVSSTNALVPIALGTYPYLLFILSFLLLLLMLLDLLQCADAKVLIPLISFTSATKSYGRSCFVALSCFLSYCSFNC